MLEALLARHAESEANARGIVNGDPSATYPLSPEGTAQAKALGRQLADRIIDLCVITEFARTSETADIALAGRDVPRLLVPELNDPDFGFLEGRTLAETREWFTAHGPAERPDGGERRVDTIERYCRGFRLVTDRPEAILLVVAHALPVTVMRLAAEGGELPLTLAGIPPDHASIHPVSEAQMERGLAAMDRWVGELSAR
jgi:broad specificity phosphatase PhoE